MDARELIDAGRLSETIAELTTSLKSKPMDGQLRVALFEALCFQGDFTRALRQLDALASGGSNVGADLAVQVYRDLIKAEQQRREVFAGRALPTFFFAPPGHVEHYLLMLHKLAVSPAEGCAMLAAAEEATPPRRGQAGDRRFEDFRDADDRLAPIFEVLHDGRYLWLPMEQVRRLTISPPKRLRDLLWIHAQVEAYEASIGDVFLPVLYPDSQDDPDELVRLGRRTEWRAIEDQLVAGVGRRAFLIDGEATSMLDLGELSFDHAVATKASV